MKPTKYCPMCGGAEITKCEEIVGADPDGGPEQQMIERCASCDWSCSEGGVDTAGGERINFCPDCGGQDLIWEKELVAVDSEPDGTHTPAWGEAASCRRCGWAQQGVS